MPPLKGEALCGFSNNLNNRRVVYIPLYARLARFPPFARGTLCGIISKTIILRKANLVRRLRAVASCLVGRLRNASR